MKTIHSLLACLLITPLPVNAGIFSLSVNSEGVVIECDAGKFTLNPPNLSLKEDDYEGQKPQINLKNEETLAAKYPDGLEIEITVDKKTNTACYTFSTVPEAKGLRFGMLIPIKFNQQGGRFAFDDAPLQALPLEKKEQYLFTGSAKRFRLVNVKGEGVAITPPASWQGLQDNRVFNWDTYQYQFLYDFLSYPGKRSLTVLIEPVTP